ncbi:glycosyltransferase family 4 protein [Phycicoccus avicenniae]|uniref:glycosyltransferase family 4 protein n=1 Tax=Phycicoccus avicenniae TaxID=2828860 RepID=UPI003D27CC70
MSLRVLMLTQWYDPEGGAAGHPGVVARALRDLGHEVHVVTGVPIYPLGKVFPEYRNRLYQRELIDGVTVHRGPIFPSHDARASRRMATYLSFALSGILTTLRGARGVDVVYVYSSPATTALPALVLGPFRRWPVVLHIQDLWPDSVTASGFVASTRAGLVERLLHRFCALTYRRSTTVAVSAPGMIDILEERGVPADKLRLVPNWADEEHFGPRPRSQSLAAELGLQAPTVVMYAGNFGELQDLGTVVDAAALLRDRDDILVALVGSGVAEARLKAAVTDRGLTNVRFVPPQPFEEIATVLALADAQLVTLKDVPLLRSTLPSKLQANLAAGHPVIGAVRGDAASVIADSGSGIVVPPGDARALADAIARFAELPLEARAEMGRTARSTYEHRFSRATVSAMLDRVLREAVADG